MHSSSRKLHRWLRLFSRISFWKPRTIPVHARRDPETLLRYHLIVRFANIGLVTGVMFAVAHALGGLYLSAALILTTTLWLSTTWPHLRHPQAPLILGNYFALLITLALVFGIYRHGGIHSTGIAWLTAPPLISLLIAGRTSAFFWCTISVTITVAFAVIDTWFPTLPFFSPEPPHPLVLVSGFAGLPVFVLLLALSLEQARQKAFAQFQTANAKLTAANLELHRTYEEKNELVGIAAHDLKNPLCVVLNLAEFIKLDNRARLPEIDVHATSIARSAERMQKIIGDMLNINALEQRALAARWDPVDLGALLADLLSIWQAGARQKNIAIHYQSPLAPVIVAGDRQALERVADNLISNACKYSPAHTTVRLALQVEGRQARLTVADEGAGIPPNLRSVLFQKYQRQATPVAKSGPSSHGLGLYIVKRFVAAMQGTVECDPLVQRGARFVVRLPLADTATPPPTAANAGFKNRAFPLPENRTGRIAPSPDNN
ncbi:MAG: HAMP domain-containing histidine kinase [Opitutae bacterium]|nr:HAMP domain-containing histidine kinase [Opitutae bacterium]